MPKSNSKIVCVCVKNNGSSLRVLQTEEITYFIMDKLKYLVLLKKPLQIHYQEQNKLKKCIDEGCG